MRNIFLAILIATATPALSAEYFCEVNKKISVDKTYSEAELKKWQFSVKVKDFGDKAIISRCSFVSSEGKVTCDDYNSDFVYSDVFVGHKKYFHFSSQFDLQILASLDFVENNGRGVIGFGRCKLERP